MAEKSQTDRASDGFNRALQHRRGIRAGVKGHFLSGLLFIPPEHAGKTCCSGHTLLGGDGTQALNQGGGSEPEYLFCFLTSSFKLDDHPEGT